MKKFGRPIIGVMGPGNDATEGEIAIAEHLGREIAKRFWWVLTGGKNVGIMNAAPKGAKEYNTSCMTIGILPHRGDLEHTSEYIDIPIPTGLGEGRNNMNVMTSDYVIICCNEIGTSPGTYSELIFALKHNKPIICTYACKDDIGNTGERFEKNYEKVLTLADKNWREKRVRIISNVSQIFEQIENWINEDKSR